MTYVTSDLHFFHRNIISYCNRPYEFDEMNETIIQKYNSVVKPGDTCYILGDLMFGVDSSEAGLRECISRLNGRKILVRGNHDKLSDQDYKNMGFYEVYDFVYFSGGICLCHYPFLMNKYTTPQEYDIINNTKLHELEQYEKDNKLPISPKTWFNLSNIKILYHGHIHERNPKDHSTDNILRINCCIDYKSTEHKPIKLGIHELVLSGQLQF